MPSANIHADVKESVPISLLPLDKFENQTSFLLSLQVLHSQDSVLFLLLEELNKKLILNSKWTFSV